MAVKSKTVQDAGAPLIVDHFHRKVTVPAPERIIGVVGDHCSEQVTFQIARKIDNHDMLECPIKYVAWRNVNGEPGTDELAVVESDDEKILLGWTIRDRVAAAKGLVDFSLHFERRDPVTGAKQYSWGTFKCTECEILDSVNATIPTAYAAVYIDGIEGTDEAALVFADYTPVNEGMLELHSCITPEAPKISLENGEVIAESYGLTTTKQLDPPNITEKQGSLEIDFYGLKTERFIRAAMHAKRAPVIIEHTHLGFLIYQDIDETTNTMVETTINFSDYPYGEKIQLNIITGSRVVVNTGRGTELGGVVQLNGTKVLDGIKFAGSNVSYHTFIVPETTVGGFVQIFVN